MGARRGERGEGGEGSKGLPKTSPSPPLSCWLAVQLHLRKCF